MVTFRLRHIFGSCLLVIALLGCTASNKEEITSAVDDALYYLSRPVPECQNAIDVLVNVGVQDHDPRYLQALASAYACRGNFSELELFQNISTISSNFTNFFASLASLPSSEQTEAESVEFLDLQVAIDTLLYSAGRTTPSAAQMKVVFGDRHGTNLNMQALYMVLVQLGRFNRWYGRTNAAGKKGLVTGVQESACFFNYTTMNAQSVSTSHGAGNACDASNVGSPDLTYADAVTTTNTRRRLCQGAMLMNNLLNLLENITFPTGTSTGQLSQLAAALRPNIDSAAALDPSMGAFIANLSQEACEANAAINDETLQLYFAALFEAGLP